MAAIEQTEQGLRLRIFLQPKAAQDKVVGLHQDELKISITAPPIEGAANAHLLKYLAKLFKVPKTALVLEKGELSRHKQIFVPTPKQIPAEIKAFYSA
ncbi:hypothetical protein EDC45_1802 [Mesocricetibacter intestinalis]|uniref:UPF0235 protein EDC45_1802 n=1 Tax=Mesocricetibacter intestinalis TaxID=1521930 RepID=A0A4R6V771_9PAST|nr:DUF167 family protein YggU [Mesocricetibacter intestinalis]TDQ56843.1 hypothetical protein EDC45_1802 [Mesocricetibacter intestinalis]